MKKIIAMLLCVAMVAAFAVSAFAAGPFVLHGKESYIGDYYTKDWEDAMDDVFGASYLEGYAKQLSAAKKALANAKKDLADMQAAAIDAIAVAQNYAVATMYEAAMYQLEADVTKAIGDFYFDVAMELAGGDVTALPATLPVELWLK